MSKLRRHWPSLLPWLLVMVVLLAFPFLFYDWTRGRHSGFVLTLMLNELERFIIPWKVN